MTFHDLVIWCSLMLPIMMSPGPANIATASVSASHGWKAAFAFCSGVMTTNIVVTSLVGCGMGALYARYHSFFHILEHLGALYIIYLGYYILKSASKPKKSSGSESKLTYKDGVLLQLLNAKFYPTVLMMFSIFIDEDSSSVFDVAVLVATFLIAAAINYVLWTLVGAELSKRQNPVTLWIQRYGFGGTLSLVGLWLLLH